MTNNQLCDILGLLGCVIAFISLVACFFGVSAWWVLGFGIALILFSQYEYED